MTTQKIKIGDTWYPVNEAIAIAEGDGGGGVTDHGLLDGLGDDDHTQYLNNARGDARYDAAGTAAAGDASHVADGDPHSQYLEPDEVIGGSNISVDTTTTPGSVIVNQSGGGGVTDHGALTGLNDDDHPQYQTQAAADQRYDFAGEATAGDSAHVAAPDPHAQYLTNAEGDSRYDPTGTAYAGDSSHLADLDPHDQYLTPAEGDAAYEALGDGMVWKGAWTSNFTYEANDVVRDDSWSMVANKNTTDKPAPQSAGEPFNVYEGLDPTATVSSKSIIFGNRYIFGQGGYITGYRIYTVAGSDYIVYSIKDPDGDRIIEQLLTFSAKTTGWNSFSISNTLVAVGTVVELICSVTEPPAAPVSFVGDWDYSTPNNNGTPSSGEIIHSNKESQSLRVNKDDITATDRDAELATLTVGDIIRNITGSWTIQGISSTATYYDFTITPTTQIADGTQEFTFETVVVASIEFVSDTNYWLSSSYNVKGLYSSDGSSAGIVLDDNAYGVDITVQHALVSDDWDVLASPGSGGSSGSGEGVSDHGGLSGLNDDDHPQYFLADGTRALTGEMDAGNQNITDVNNLYTFNTTAVTVKVDNLEAGLDPPDIEVLDPLRVQYVISEDDHVPHKGYVDSADASHVADGDPHSQYQTPAEHDLSDHTGLPGVGVDPYGEHLMTLIDPAVGGSGSFGYRGDVVTARPTTPTYSQGARALIDTTLDPTYVSPPLFVNPGDAWIPNGDAIIAPGEPAQTAVTGLAFSTAKNVGGIVVASSAAPQSVKDQADYICDGVADQVQINDALIQATRPGDGFGGEGHIAVYLVGPQFNISDSILMPPSVALRGGGRGTLVSPPNQSQDSSDKGAVELLNANAGQRLTLEDFTIGRLNAEKFGWDGIRLLGNASGDDYEIWTGSDSYALLRNMCTLDTTKKGIWVGGPGGANGMRETQITGCLSWNAVGVGLHIDGASDSKIIHTLSVGNAGRAAGFLIAGGNTMLTACKSYYRGNSSGGNTSPGFHFTSSRITAHGCESQDNGGHGFVIEGTDSTLSDCIGDSNSAQSAGFAGFNIRADGVYSGLHAFDRAQSTLKQNIGILFANTPSVMLTGKVSVSSGSSHISGSINNESYARVVREGSTVWEG